LAYIGNIPAESYASFETETFSVSATANYTLSHAVTNENEIRLVINGVVQQPGSGKAYTASGTTLTLSSATVSGDSMYAVYLGRALQTVNPPNASVGSAQIADDLISGKTALGATPADTDELLISDAGTLKRVDYSHLKSANTPAFQGYLSANQSISDNSDTKININTESFDTDSAYNNSTYKFIPQTAGKYLFYANVVTSAGDDNNIAMDVKIYKNGSIAAELNYNAYANSYAATLSSSGSIILEANGSSDYFELYAKSNDYSGTPTALGNSSYPKTYFGAYKLIGV